MVVLTAAVLSSGKTLLARQFVEMTRLRVEGLMSAFSKLVDSGRDHTFIETESVRYIYQPMEALYLVLVTNKASNILEDLETLRLLAKVVQDCCQIQVNEELVLKHAFDIVFAFDEVISFGHRESVTLSQIKTYTEMDSHEEKLHQMMEQSKMNEVREIAKKKQLELAKQRAMQPKDSTPTTGFGSDNSGGGGGGGGAAPGMTMRDSSSTSGGVTIESSASPPPSYELSPSTIRPGAPKRGMALGKKRPGDVFGGLGPTEPAPGEAAAEVQAEPAEPAPINPLLDPVQVEIAEKITADLQADGGLQDEVVCNGKFEVTVLDPSKGDLACFKLAPQSQEFKYKVNPMLNKASHANNLLEPKDASKAYRANVPEAIVKWQVKSQDEAFLPVSISCWPKSTADSTEIVVELELTDSDASLENVVVRFRAEPSSRPTIASAEPGEAEFNAGMHQVVWKIPVLDKSESTGNLEFSAHTDTASLLPFTFEAVRRGRTRCPMEITQCYHQASQDSISFSCSKATIYELRVGV